MKISQKVKLGEIAKIKGGKRLPKSFEVQDDITNHPYIRVTDMDERGLILTNIKYISDEVFFRIKNYTISSDDIYISIAGTIGRVGIVPKNYSGANLTENAAKITNIDKNYNYKFIMYFLQSNYGQGLIKNRIGGTSQPKLPLYRVEKITIPNLIKDKQDYIVEVIEKYNHLIDTNRRRIRLLEESARLLFREWFVYFCFPGHEKMKIVDGVPEGWGKENIGKIGYLNYGKSLVEETREEGDVKVYGSSGVVGVHSKSLVEGPGIIVGRKGNVGAIYWVNDSYWPIDTVYYIKREQSNLFLYLSLKTIGFINTDASVPGLNRDYAHSKTILVPAKDLLGKFLKQVNDIYNMVKILTTQNQKLAQARDLLLPRLMSGAIDPH